MTLVAALFVLGLTQAAPPQSAPSNAKATMEQAGAFLLDAFKPLDGDRSGYLDLEEVSRMEPRDAHRDPGLPAAPAGGARDPAAEAKWMGKMDADRNGRVSREEYVEYMVPWIMLHGVPAGWKPRG